MSWFKKLFKKTKEKVDKDAEHLVYVFLPRERVQPGYDDAVLSGNAHYFRLWLVEMFLAKETQWLKTYAPVVHSVVRLQFGGGGAVTPDVELPHVAGPLQLKGVEEGNLNRTINLNHALTGLLPFRGGTVELAAGLMRAKQRDLLNDMVGVLGDLSGLITVPQLSAALAVVQPLADGLGKLLAGPDQELWLGLHDTFVGAGGDAADNLLRPGYIAAVNTGAKAFDQHKLCVRGGRLCMGDDVATAPQLEGYDYMLFRIESRTEREKDQWEELHSISKPWAEALAHLRAEASDKALNSLRAAIYATQTSADLTSDDVDKVIGRLKSRYKQAKQQYDLSDLAAVPTATALELSTWTLGHIMTESDPNDGAILD